MFDLACASVTMVKMFRKFNLVQIYIHTYIHTYIYIYTGVDHDFTGTNARERWRLRQEARGGSKVVQGTQDGKLSMERSASHQSFASTSTNGTVANHEINDEFDMIYEL